MKRRSHKLYIDVKFSAPVSKRQAIQGLQRVLDTRLDLQKEPVWPADNSPYIDKLTVFEEEYIGQGYFW